MLKTRLRLAEATCSSYIRPSHIWAAAIRVYPILYIWYKETAQLSTNSKFTKIVLFESCEGQALGVVSYCFTLTILYSKSGRWFLTGIGVSINDGTSREYISNTPILEQGTYKQSTLGMQRLQGHTMYVNGLNALWYEHSRGHIGCLLS